MKRQHKYKHILMHDFFMDCYSFYWMQQDFIDEGGKTHKAFILCSIKTQ